MNTEQEKNRLAQPAEEELKKHGDQLQKQVNDAAEAAPQERQDGKTSNSQDN